MVRGACVVRPILPEVAFRPLRAMCEAGFDHRVVLRTVATTLQANRERTVAVTEAEPIAGQLVVADARDHEFAAARGIRVQWILKLVVGTPIAIGQLADVTDACQGWTRTVEITGDLGRTGRINRRLAAVDVALNTV